MASANAQIQTSLDATNRRRDWEYEADLETIYIKSILVFFLIL